MQLTVRSTLLLWGILAAGINSGSFFAFSNFVMRSLARLAPAQGARAMQEINRAAPNPVFMATLLGGAVTGVALVAMAPGEPGAGWQAAGGVLSALTALITIAFHVPRNDALQHVDPDSSEGHDLWARYLVGWTRGNHVRTATAAASLICLTLAAAA